MGGKSVKLTDDDGTLRRKIGFRRLMLESRLADRLMIGFWIALVLLGVVSLIWLLK